MKQQTIDSSTMRKIYSWIEFACEKNDTLYLASHIRIKFTPRFTRKFAEAGYGIRPLRARIRISPMIWQRATPKERFETIIHEACHIVAFHLYGVDIKPHGVEWRQAMKNCGVEPMIYHNISLVGINKFYIRDCPKEDRCFVNKRNLDKLRKGGLLHCTICGKRIDADSIEV